MQAAEEAKRKLEEERLAELAAKQKAEEEERAAREARVN